MTKKTHMKVKLHKGEIFTRVRDGKGRGRGGGVGGEAQSNLLVALMNFIVSRIIVLLSVSGSLS